MITGRARGARSATMTLLLDQLADGAQGIVQRVLPASAELDATQLRRLAELGFIPGEPVQVLRRGPGGKDPLAVRVGDALFALRRAEARCIEVR